jgi:hypothetical protein
MTQQPVVGLGLLITKASRLHSVKHTILRRTPLDEWSARRRDLYLATHNTHKGETYMPPAWFEPVSPASERPQAHALDPATTGIGRKIIVVYFKDHMEHLCKFCFQSAGFLNIKTGNM